MQITVVMFTLNLTPIFSWSLSGLLICRQGLPDMLVSMADPML